MSAPFEDRVERRLVDNMQCEDLGGPARLSVGKENAVELNLGFRRNTSMSPPIRSPVKGVCKELQTVSDPTFEICDVPFRIQLFAQRRWPLCSVGAG